MAEKKDEQVIEKGAVSGGRPLFLYFLPSVVVGILLMLLVSIIAQQTVNGAAGDAARLSAKGVAAALAGRISGEITARRDLMALALAGSRAGDALASGDDGAIAGFETLLRKRIPGLLQVRLLPMDWNQPDPGGAAPLGYAGLDMLRRVSESGQPAPAEIHQTKSSAPYLAYAMPVRADGRNLGVLFAAWDMRGLVQTVETSASFPGRLALLQGGEAGYVVAKGPGDGDDGRFSEGQVEVPESIWSIGYLIEPESSNFGGLIGMLAIAGGGGLALLLIAFLQWRMLSGDIRADMLTLVNLGEAILNGKTTAVGHANLASNRDAIALRPAAVG